MAALPMGSAAVVGLGDAPEGGAVILLPLVRPLGGETAPLL